jgi:hypothetical protein
MRGDGFRHNVLGNRLAAGGAAKKGEIE